MAVVIPYVRQTHIITGSWTAAKANVVEDGTNDAHFQPTVRVYHNATQSLTTATFTALAFNTERWDTAGGAASTQHDTATNNSRLTCRYAGKYQVNATASFVQNATGQRQLFVRINATASQFIGLDAMPGNTSSPNVLRVATIIDLAVNDYIELFAYQSSGGALNIEASTSSTDQYQCEFMMARVG